MANIIKVSPDKLNQAASEISGIQSSITNITGTMTSIVQSMSTEWQGDASQTYIQKFTGLQDDMQRMSAMLNEHVNDLQQMAATYQQAESNAASISGGLADDVIQ